MFLLLKDFKLSYYNIILSYINNCIEYQLLSKKSILNNNKIINLYKNIVDLKIFNICSYNFAASSYFHSFNFFNIKILTKQNIK